MKRARSFKAELGFPYTQLVGRDVVVVVFVVLVVVVAVATLRNPE